MRILCKEHLEETKRYAESIGDKSLQECLKRLESWEKNPDRSFAVQLEPFHGWRIHT